MEVNSKIAIIPCAGHGSRMGKKKSIKSLEVIAGKTILEHLITILSDYVDYFFIPISHDSFRNEIFKKKLPKNLLKKILFVKSVAGSGDGQAVLDSLRIINEKYKKNNHVLVCWGDTYILNKSFVVYCYENLNKYSRYILTFPSALVKNPYVGFLRDNKGKIMKAIFTKRGDRIMNCEKDFSIFFIKPKNIQQELELMKKKLLKSDGTLFSYKGELNFLDLIYWLYRKKINIKAFEYNLQNYNNPVVSFNSLNELKIIKNEI